MSFCARHRRRTSTGLDALCAAVLGGAVLLTQAATDGTDTTPIRIFIQGSSSSLLAELVRQHGGTVTHMLPLIDGVGATLPRAAAARMALLPAVTRVIDDLDLEEEANSSPVPPRCQVAGALDVQLTDGEVRWTLYNKGEQPAQPQQIRLEWPASWGTLRTATANGHVLPANAATAGAKHRLAATLVTEQDTASLPGNGRGELTLRFQQPPQAAADAQNALQWTVRFGEACETRLFPAYADSENNTYYPQVVGADALHRLGVTGRGVTVAVIDSGLWEHPALLQDASGRDRVVARYNAITDQVGDVFDESGHGTHISSTIAQSEPVTSAGIEPGSYKGIAPDVDLVAIKAFNYEGQADFLDLVRAIQFVVDQREALDIRVLNLSFAARPRWQYWLDPVNQAVMRAWAAGITVVAAAGNEGPEPMTIGAPGNLPYVITVGAVTDSWTPDDRRDDYIPDFSSAGPTPEGHIKPEIVAPGGHIPGFTRPEARLLRDFPEYQLTSGAFVMTGSSQASAVVAGIAALLIQLEPGLTPDQLKCMLTSSAEPAIHPDGRLAYSPFKQGYGYVNAIRATTLGKRDCGNTGLSIESDLRGLQHFEGPAIVTDTGDITLPGLDVLLNPNATREAGRPARIYWGAKDYVESSSRLPSADKLPIDWYGIYARESDAVQAISDLEDRHP